MGAKQIQYRVCDRPHDNDVDAVVTDRFSLNGDKWTIDLCQEHSAELWALLTAWGASGTQTAEGSVLERATPVRKVEFSTKPERKPVESNVVSLPTAPEVAVAPGERKWRLTEHAIERMAERDWDIRTVMEAAERPEFVEPHGMPGEQRRRRGDCTVVVACDTNEIITVWPRNARSYARAK